MIGKTKRGFSMIELMVAIVIIGLAIGPLILVLSDSNKANNASMYEEMATHYARELAHQLLRMDKDVPLIVGEANCSFKIVLESINGTSAGKLSDLNMKKPYCIALRKGANVLDYRLMVSPLIQPIFKSREIKVKKLDVSSNDVLKTGNFWNIIITIKWIDPNSGRAVEKELNMDVVIHER